MSEYKISRVIEEEQGKAVIEPIKLGGVTVTHCDVDTADEMYINNFVIVTRVDDVIPTIVKVIK